MGVGVSGLSSSTTSHKTSKGLGIQVGLGYDRKGLELHLILEGEQSGSRRVQKAVLPIGVA